MHFKTSRQTDRGADADVEGRNGRHRLRESARAAARVVRRPMLTTLNDRDRDRCGRTSRLPDGRAFDPRTVAIVDPANHPATSHFSPGASDVARVTRRRRRYRAFRVDERAKAFSCSAKMRTPAGARGSTVRRSRSIAPTSRCRASSCRRASTGWSSRWNRETLRAGLALSGAGVLTCLVPAGVQRTTSRRMSPTTATKTDYSFENFVFFVADSSW